MKQWEWTHYAPLESFILRPYRLAVTRRDYQRVANTLVQSGLDLVCDVRLAHINLAVANRRLRIAGEGVELRKAVADLTERRLDRGEISELEATTARIDTHNAEAAAGLIRQDAVTEGNLRYCPPSLSKGLQVHLHGTILATK